MSDRRMVTLTLPWPTSANAHWRTLVFGRHAKPCISRDGRDFRKNVAACVWKACGGKPVPMQGRLHVSITLHQPTRAKCDIDNRVKTTLDALTHAGLWGDDSQVDMLTVERGPVCRPGGRASVVVTEIAHGPADAPTGGGDGRQCMPLPPIKAKRTRKTPLTWTKDQTEQA